MYDARQHAILTAMGIRQWIPRASTTAKNSSASSGLWRQSNDMAGIDITPLPDPSVLAQAVTQETAHIPALSENMAVRPVGAIKSVQNNAHFMVQNSHHVAAVQQAEASPSVITDDKLEQVRDDTGVLVQNFRLHACEINQWIVLVNETDLQDPQCSTLWKNILRAFQQPEINQFSWPLSEGQRWQRMTGAKAALNGFLFRLGLDKRVGLMSELADEVCPDRIERLPHLSELIQQPLKKRLLWHLLKAQ